MPKLTKDFPITKEAQQSLDHIKKNMGMVANIFKLMAHSSNVLDGYLYFHNSLNKGTLTAQEREYISLLAASLNQCEYCSNAHATIAKKTGITLEEIKETFQGKSNDQKIQSLLHFVTAIIKNHGHINDQQLINIKNASYSDTQIVEIIACVAVNIFTNYFNNIVQPEVDFAKIW